MSESLPGILISLLVAIVLGYWWWKDFEGEGSEDKAETLVSGVFVFLTDIFPLWKSIFPESGSAARLQKTGETEETGLSKPMPGATPCGGKFIAAGVAGAVLLVFLETAGEHALGISGEQKNIPALFLLAMLSAAVVEEIVFRGYLVIEGKGRIALIGGILAASFAFAMMHDFLWQYHEVAGAAWWEFWRGFSPNFTGKGVFSFAFIFAGSLYFYLLRFHPRNRNRSLLPCFAAHAAKNLAVFSIKLAEGHVVVWW